ncbi:MAG: hypothetical protein M1831_002875 [Alyxoria varia]|nr:MAG: hypothetical protein M1831_002875 [Alyxoria varia]
MAGANISFYVVTGAEIHWRQARSFHGDAAGVKTLLYGSTGCILAVGFILAVAWVLMPYIYNGTGAVLSSLKASLAWLVCWRRNKNESWTKASYQQVPSTDYQDDDSQDKEARGILESPARVTKEKSISIVKKLAILIPTILLVTLRAVRPHESAYTYLSWALPFSPLAGLGSHGGDIDVTGMKGNVGWLSNKTALSTTPPNPHWDLPPGLEGFEDWYYDNKEGKKVYRFKHYHQDHDPLKISNLKNGLLDSLKSSLHGGDVKIKHVVFIKLESTRKDVFPLKKNSFLWDSIADSHDDERIPSDVQEMLANLTRTAEFVTGDHTGFQRNGEAKKSRGGITASNAFTTGTYTLKSLTGSLCGITPLIADFNREFSHHIYQPCLAHIFTMFNRQSNHSAKPDDFTTWPWHSRWMQSVTDGYDNQKPLTNAMGYHDIITKEWLKSRKSKFGPSRAKDVNYYGLPDTELRKYVRDTFKRAEKNHQRVFLTHLTGTTHHPWGVPHDDFDPLMGGETGKDRDVNRYLNSIGFVDGWLKKILSILEETKVADETLVVFCGDHGLSLPENGGVTPYDNPHVGAFHIPIVFSHPKLPQIEISSPVMANQIVPTILDLLVETGSVTNKDLDKAKDLLPIYEGQSMIRPLIGKENGHPDYQWTVMNTGGSWLAVRSGDTDYRLVIPLVADVEWRFSDLESDPHEENPILEFDPHDLSKMVEARHGKEASKWVGNAARVAKWYVPENRARWEYEIEGANA